MSACSCSVSGSWNNIVIIWCCSIMVWISHLYFIICFMILITTFLFVGLYHKLSTPAAGCQHNILWISKWILETNNELKQAHPFSAADLSSPLTEHMLPMEAGLYIVAIIIIIIMIDWLAEENSLVRCLYWMARYLGQNTTTCIQN